MIRRHDRWSKMGEANLGSHNIEWAKKMEEFSIGVPGSGPLTLMKSIMNDHWADVVHRREWSKDHVDLVMSKLYWCWVAWLEATHVEVGEKQ